MLLGLAEKLELRDLRKAVTHWANCADAVAAERTFAEQQEASYLFVSLTADDMVKIDGLLDKETGEAVLTALDAAMTPEARADGATGDLHGFLSVTRWLAHTRRTRRFDRPAHRHDGPDTPRAPRDPLHGRERRPVRVTAADPHPGGAGLPRRLPGPRGHATSGSM